jgi:hypothetical protein
MVSNEMGCEGSVDYIHRAHDRAERWAVVNTVINLRVSYKTCHFFTG